MWLDGLTVVVGLGEVVRVQGVVVLVHGAVHQVFRVVAHQLRYPARTRRKELKKGGKKQARLQTNLFRVHLESA